MYAQSPNLPLSDSDNQECITRDGTAHKYLAQD